VNADTIRRNSSVSIAAYSRLVEHVRRSEYGMPSPATIALATVVIPEPVLPTTEIRCHLVSIDTVSADGLVRSTPFLSLR
jgi:hypothetical protein